MITEDTVTLKQKAQFYADSQSGNRALQEGRVLAMAAIQRAKKSGIPVSPVDLAEADRRLMEAQNTFQRLTKGLAEAGLLKRPDAGSLPLTDDLAGLAVLASQDTRELLATLEKAQQIAERIDAARGRSLGDSIPLHPGESAGTDLAESISLLALRVRQEVHGARSPHE